MSGLGRLVVFIFLCLGSAPSFAISFGNPIRSFTAKPAGSDLAGTQSRTVAEYVAANKLIIGADIKFAKALKLDADVATLQATSDALTTGPSEDSLKNTDTTMTQSAADISAAMKTNPTLDAQAKEEFAGGLVLLAGGSFAYVKVGQGLKSSQSAISGAPPMELLKIRPLLYIAKTVPGNAKNLSNSLEAATEFARGQGIPVPNNAADATAALNF